jgi:hypothetical protein
VARKAWMGVNGGVGSAFFFDGLFAGIWRADEGRVSLEVFFTPTKSDQRAIDAEVARVEEFLATPV